MRRDASVQEIKPSKVSVQGVEVYSAPLAATEIRYVAEEHWLSTLKFVPDNLCHALFRIPCPELPAP